MHLPCEYKRAAKKRGKAPAQPPTRSGHNRGKNAEEVLPSSQSAPARGDGQHMDTRDATNEQNPAGAMASVAMGSRLCSSAANMSGQEAEESDQNNNNGSATVFGATPKTQSHREHGIPVHDVPHRSDHNKLSRSDSVGGKSFSGWLNEIPPASSSAHCPIPPSHSSQTTSFATRQTEQDHIQSSAALRYPVLKPALQYFAPIIPTSLACDLLEQYFASATSAFQHPSSPYVTAYIFRKRSFFHPTEPRLCSAALLVSMLWVAAQTSGSSYLTSSVVARSQICQKLLELTITLLKPLVHQPSERDDTRNPIIDGVVLGGFGISDNLPLPEGRHSADAAQYTNYTSMTEVDDITTYMHLATVISASEYKAASMRWWNVVYSLARELHFSHEAPQGSEYGKDAVEPNHGDFDRPKCASGQIMTEELREERRRVWWLAYTVDRHLALCYNQPLHILDFECTRLFRPVPETHWQAGDEYHGPAVHNTDGVADARPRGATLDVTGHGVFGFFTPLMTLLGECIELQQARMHPRLGVGFRALQFFEDWAEHIRMHIEEYTVSLATFRARNLPEALVHVPSHMGDTHHASSLRNHDPTLPTEDEVQTTIVCAYATYIQHVLLILLTGQWDPLTLLDSPPASFIATPAFITATGAAISAAESLAPILEHDPDLSFMPWFFGIYLLQGSFLLLLFADRLGKEAGERYVGACERSIRAVESCVVTLATAYQRDFRRVMRSALQQVGRRGAGDGSDESVGDIDEHVKRREVLALYRWTAEGRGLAV